MPDVEGGILERFLEESLYQRILGGLTQLGWFQPGRSHSPIVPLQEGVPTYESIEKNTLVINFESADDDLHELGGDVALEDTYLGYAQFFAEDLSVGAHLSGDIRAILRGGFPSIGYDTPVLEIFDYRHATPPVIGYALIENVRREQNAAFSRPWKATLFDVQYTINAASIISVP